MEAQNFESRKHLLEYDDVMNKQRETVYGLRRQLLEGSDQKEFVMDAADRVVGWLVENQLPQGPARRHVEHCGLAHGILGKVRTRSEEARAAAGSPAPAGIDRRA